MKKARLSEPFSMGTPKEQRNPTTTEPCFVSFGVSPAKSGDLDHVPNLTRVLGKSTGVFLESFWLANLTLVSNLNLSWMGERWAFGIGRELVRKWSAP